MEDGFESPKKMWPLLEAPAKTWGITGSPMKRMLENPQASPS